MRIASLWALAVMAASLLGVGGTPMPRGAPRETMPIQTPQLVGDWEKITTSQCSQMYPERIQFRANGLYFAQNDPSSGFIVWDVGEYAMVSAQQVKISLANDAVAAYKFAILNDVLTFIDPDGCAYSYRQAVSTTTP